MDSKEQLTREEQKFAELFLRWRDIYKAADKAKIPRSRAVRVFNKPSVQEEIERQMEVVRRERARQQVAEESLTNQLLDGELIQVIRNKETPVSVKLDGIRLGYVATGKIQVGTTRLLEGGAPGDGLEAGGAVVFQPFVPMGMAVRPLMGAESAESAAAGPAAAPEPGEPAPVQKPAAAADEPAAATPKAARPDAPAAKRTARRDGPETIRLG